MAPKLKQTVASSFMQALTDELTKNYSGWLIENHFKTFDTPHEALSLSRPSWPRGWAIRIEMEVPHFKNFCIGFHNGKPLADELHRQRIEGAVKEPLVAIGRRCGLGGPWVAWCRLPDPFRNWTPETFFC